MRNGSSIEHVCHSIHREMYKSFKYALVWGSSAKHAPQRVGIQHMCEDEDVVQVRGKKTKKLTAGGGSWKPAGWTSRTRARTVELTLGPLLSLFARADHDRRRIVNRAHMHCLFSSFRSLPSAIVSPLCFVLHLHSTVRIDSTSRSSIVARSARCRPYRTVTLNSPINNYSGAQ